MAFPGVSTVKESTCQCRRYRFNSWAGKMPWRRKWQPTPVFLPGQSHGQRSLVGYSPWGRKDSDTSVQLSTHVGNLVSPWSRVVSLLGLAVGNLSPGASNRDEGVFAPQNSAGYLGLNSHSRDPNSIRRKMYLMCLEDPG